MNETHSVNLAANRGDGWKVETRVFDDVQVVRFKSGLKAFRFAFSEIFRLYRLRKVAV